MDIFDYLLLIVVFLITFLTLGYIRIFRPMILPKLQMKRAARTPEIRAQATLISKTKEIGFRSYSTPTVLYLTFELQNGQHKVFWVDTNTYNSILEKEEGVLTYHELGNTRVFVSFQRTR